ncbi:MAG TPA: tRNA (adenosine(37)-N6)-threonylcarbamoyltransferase complex dimerization subunit type 1 TsaB [Candidatus Binataceae bacterium]|nr:tRNA (adenosine(37)-N6)-threonylcarbamoyltransferase complex dimerization subunit type 1 TsaB [Candidatus Binataceae bacterium]
MTSRVLFRVDRLLEEAASAGLVLGIDTATERASLALIDSGRIVAECARPTASHGADLPDFVAALIAVAGASFKDLRGIAVGIGPGSFTGLRVGLSYVKGLAFALGCGVVGISTFDAIALGVREAYPGVGNRPICTIFDARKNEVYAALYRIVADGVERSTDTCVGPVEELAHRISGEAILAGDSKVIEVSDALRALNENPALVDQTDLDSRGRYIAAIGAMRLVRGESDSPAALEPLYVRPPETIFRRRAAGPEAAITKEGPWSEEKKNSSSSI